MKDEDKTKSQLIDELREMRARVAELEPNRPIRKHEKMHAEAMGETEERLRLVLNATNDGIWDWNTGTGQVYFSPRCYTMLGYEPDEFPPTRDNWRRLIHPEDVEAAEAAIGYALKEHTLFAVEFRMKAKNEEWLWILCRGKAVELDTDSESVRMVGSHTDITERKLSEKSLRLTQFIFEKAPIGIWKMGKDGKILDVNEQGVNSLGYSRDELCRMIVFDFAPGFYPKDWANGVSILNEIGSRTIEAQHQRRNGEIFPVQVIEKLVRFEDEDFHVAFVQDISERKRIEESLRLARSIIDRANIGIYLIAPEGQIILVNQKAARLLGYTKEELEKLSVADLDPQVRRELWSSHWQKLNMQDSRSRSLEREHRRKDGSLIPVQVYSNFLEYEGQEYAVAFVQDISERKQNEERLREKDKLLHDIGRLVKVGAWKFDLETGKENWTEEVARILGFEPDQDVSIKTRLNCYHGTHREKIEHAIHEAVKQGTPYDLESEIISAKGVRKWVRNLGRPVMKDGRVVQVQGSIQDISDIKHAEMLLKESERRYRALIQLAPLGIGIIDSKGIIVDVNQAFASMTGYKIEELLNLNFIDITHPDDLKREIELTQLLANNKKTSFSLEKRYKHKDGHYFWINITVAKAYDIYGEGTFYFGFVEEISNRKQLEYEREQLINDLQKSLAEIKELRGYIPICSKCKKVRDDAGYWQQVEKYISDRTEAQFSHGLCPDCTKKLYPDIYKKILERKKQS